jgi:hypothetical protein
MIWMQSWMRTRCTKDIATGQAKRWVQLTGIVDQVMLLGPKLCGTAPRAAISAMALL